MDGNDPNDFAPGPQADAPGVPLSLEKRLELASERRARVLRENRRAGTVKAGRSKPAWLERLRAAGAMHLPAQFSSHVLARTAVIAFSAAFGLGIGGAMGFAIFSGAPDLSARSAEPVQVSAAQIRPSDGAAKSGGVQPAAMIEGTMAFVPPLVSFEIAKLPQIRAVRYEPSSRSNEVAAAWADIPGVAPSFSAVASTPDAPEVGQARVFVHAPVSVPVTRLQSLANDVYRAGASVERVGRETFRVSQTHLRYYSEATAGQAQHLAARLQIEARDFVGSAPRNNRIELWVAGTGGQTRPELDPVQFLARLLEGVVP